MPEPGPNSSLDESNETVPRVAAASVDDTFLDKRSTAEEEKSTRYFTDMEVGHDVKARSNALSVDPDGRAWLDAAYDLGSWAEYQEEVRRKLAARDPQDRFPVEPPFLEIYREEDAYSARIMARRDFSSQSNTWPKSKLNPGRIWIPVKKIIIGWDR